MVLQTGTENRSQIRFLGTLSPTNLDGAEGVSPKIILLTIKNIIMIALLALLNGLSAAEFNTNTVTDNVTQSLIDLLVAAGKYETLFPNIPDLNIMLNIIGF